MSVRDVIRRWIARLAWTAVIVFVTIVIGGALDARRRLPDLEAWHRIVPRDARVADLTPQSTLADYLAIDGVRGRRRSRSRRWACCCHAPTWGDGRTDLTVFRPCAGHWGASGDIPSSSASYGRLFIGRSVPRPHA